MASRKRSPLRAATATGSVKRDAGAAALRGVFEWVIAAIQHADFNGANFSTDCDHGFDKTIKLRFGFRFGWLDH